MVRIRLMRVGKTKQPSYRVVVADQRSPRDGRIIESIGHYNPRIEPSLVAIDTERAEYWLGVGAQPSAQVRKLIEIARGGGEAAPEKKPAAKVTRAESVRPTPAASVADEEDAGEEPATTSKSEDEAAADATPEEGTEETSS